MFLGCLLISLLAGWLACLFVSLFLCFHFICLLVCSLRPHTMAATIASDQKKNKRYCKWQISRVCVSLSVCLLVCFLKIVSVWLLACLFLSVSLFVSFFVSLFFDYLCSDKCQNIDEDFENYQPFDGLGRPKTSIFMCAFKPHSF